MVREAGSHRRRQGRPDRIRGLLDQHQPSHVNAVAHQRRLPRRAALHYNRPPAAMAVLPHAPRAGWAAHPPPRDRENATQIRYYPVRFTDIDLFNHMNNSVYWSVIEDYLSATPELVRRPLRVTIEHEAPIALGDKLEIIAHVHPAGSTDKFGPGLVDR